MSPRVIPSVPLLLACLLAAGCGSQEAKIRKYVGENREALRDQLRNFTALNVAGKVNQADKVLKPESARAITPRPNFDRKSPDFNAAVVTSADLAALAEVMKSKKPPCPSRNTFCDADLSQEICACADLVVPDDITDEKIHSPDQAERAIQLVPRVRYLLVLARKNQTDATIHGNATFDPGMTDAQFLLFDVTTKQFLGRLGVSAQNSAAIVIGSKSADPERSAQIVANADLATNLRKNIAAMLSQYFPE